MPVLGVIPARGGSKGIPGKNLHLVAGRPLLAYTSDAALASRRLTRTIVSTDDAAIEAAARGLGLEVPFRRPAELAGDATPMLPVLTHAVAEMARAGFAADVVVLLQPTSPLRRAAHIDAAVDLLESTGADSIVSVVEVPHQFSPVSVMRIADGRLRPYEDRSFRLKPEATVMKPEATVASGFSRKIAAEPEATVTRRQDKPVLYARNGPAVLAVRTRVLEAGSLYGNDCRPYVMRAADSLDIDTPDDLAFVELVLSQR